MAPRGVVALPPAIRTAPCGAWESRRGIARQTFGGSAARSLVTFRDAAGNVSALAIGSIRVIAGDGTETVTVSRSRRAEGRSSAADTRRKNQDAHSLARQAVREATGAARHPAFEQQGALS
jgi:hypothetical protein